MLAPLGPGRCPHTTGSRAPREGADGRELSQGGAENSRVSLEGGRTEPVPAAHPPLGAELALTCSCSRLLRACFCLSAKTASTAVFPSWPRHLGEEAGPAAHLASSKRMWKTADMASPGQPWPVRWTRDGPCPWL